MRPCPSPPGRAEGLYPLVRTLCGGGGKKAHHAVDVGLLVTVVDGGEEGLLVAAALQSRVEVHGLGVVVVVAQVVVLPPAGVAATFRSCEDGR